MFRYAQAVDPLVPAAMLGREPLTVPAFIEVVSAQDGAAVNRQRRLLPST